MPNGFFLALTMIFLFLVVGILLSGLINLLIPLFRTPKKDLKKILDTISLTKDDTFIDLGSGDARVIFEARRRNREAKLLGYEISPILLIIAVLKKKLLFPFDKKLIIEAEDLFDIDYSKATKIYCYLSPEALEILKEKFKGCKSLKVYSYKYKISNKKAKDTISLPSGEKLYIYSF